MEYKGKGTIQRSVKQILHKETKRRPTQSKKLGQAPRGYTLGPSTKPPGEGGAKAAQPGCGKPPMEHYIRSLPPPFTTTHKRRRAPSKARATPLQWA
jgi:hypothetical protein